VSALTKLFVVLLVICSLLLTAATVVYVNRSEDYVAALRGKDAEIAREKENARIARMDADAAASRERDLTTASNALRDKLQSQVTTLGQEVSKLGAELGTARTNLQIKDGQITKLTAGLEAAQKGGTGLFARNEELAKEIDRLRIERTESNNIVVDLTKRLDAAERELMFTKEKLVQATQGAAEANRGGPPASIRGSVTRVVSERGQSFAIIDLGTADKVKVGDKLQIEDQFNKQFLGYIHLERVDPNSSFGRLEGPGIAHIRQNHIVVAAR